MSDAGPAASKRKRRAGGVLLVAGARRIARLSQAVGCLGVASTHCETTREASQWVDRSALVVVDWRTALSRSDKEVLRPLLGASKPPVVVWGDEVTPPQQVEEWGEAGVDDGLFGAPTSEALALRLDGLEGPGGGPDCDRLRSALVIGGRDAGKAPLVEAFRREGFRLTWAGGGGGPPLPPDLLLAESPTAPSAVRAWLARWPERPPVIAVGQTWSEVSSEAALWARSGGDVMGVFTRATSPLLVAQRALAVLRDREHGGLSTTLSRLWRLAEFRPAGDLEWRSGLLRDWGPGHLFVKTLLPVRSGSFVQLRLHLEPGAPPVEGVAAVAWRTVPDVAVPGVADAGMALVPLASGSPLGRDVAPLLPAMPSWVPS